MADESTYERADVLARAAMAIRPDLPQDQSLDEWLIEHGEKLTAVEYRVAKAALDYHPSNNPDLR